MIDFYRKRKRKKSGESLFDNFVKFLKNYKIIIALITFISTVIYSPAKDFIKGEWGGEVVLSIGDQSFYESAPNYVFFAVPHNLQQDMKFIIPMNFTVLNDSRKGDENVSLSVKYEKKYLRRIMPDHVITNRSAKMNSDLEYELNELSDYDYAKHRLKTLGAKEDFTFNEGAFADEINLGSGLPSLFQNGIAIDVKVTTDSRNTSIRNWDVRYRGVNVNNQNEMIRWFNNYYAKYIAIELRGEYGFFAYLYKLLFSDEVKAFAFYPEFTKVEGNSIYIPVNNPKEYNAFIFAPYSWDLLM